MSKQISACPKCGRCEGWYKKGAASIHSKFDDEGNKLADVISEITELTYRNYCINCNHNITNCVED